MRIEELTVVRATNLHKKDLSSGFERKFAIIAPKCFDVLNQPYIKALINVKFSSLQFAGTWDSFKEKFYNLGVEGVDFKN